MTSAILLHVSLGSEIPQHEFSLTVHRTFSILLGTKVTYEQCNLIKFILLRL